MYRNQLCIRDRRPRKPLVKLYKKSLFSQNKTSRADPRENKIFKKISTNELEIRIPHPGKPSVKLYKKSLFLRNSLAFIIKAEIFDYPLPLSGKG